MKTYLTKSLLLFAADKIAQASTIPAGGEKTDEAINLNQDLPSEVGQACCNLYTEKNFGG